MATLIKLSIILFLSAIIFTSCQEVIENDLMNKEFFSEKVTGTENAKQITGPIFIVEPTGVDDTDNIQAAFDAAVAAGPCSVVEFTAGTFLYSRPIIVANFDGTFRGAGKDQTIIENLSDSPFPLMDRGPLSGFSGLFCFYNEGTGSSTSINISDFTMQVMGESEVFNNHLQPTDIFFTAINFIGGVSGIKDFAESYANITVGNIDIIGQEGPDFIEWLNLEAGIMIRGEPILEWTENGHLYNYDKPLVGNIIIRDCKFNTMFVPIFPMVLKDSDVIITGNQIFNAAFGIWLPDFDNSISVISNNVFEEIWWIGIFIESAFQSTIGLECGPVTELFPNLPSKFLVHHNELYLHGIADGVGLVDYGIEFGIAKTMESEITENLINLENTSYGGIFSFASRDILVRENEFRGTATYAISVFPNNSSWTIHKNQFETIGWTGIEFYGSDSRIVNNDYIGYQGWGDPWWNGGGAIVLWEISSENFVAESFDGKPLICDQVLDLGISNNLPGYDVCDHNPNKDILREKSAEIRVAHEEKMNQFSFIRH